jgi:thiamine biosynthesis lipoprotein
VLAPDAALADALATAMVVLGPVEGLKIIEALPRVEAMLVDLEGVVSSSNGLKNPENKTK